MLLYFFLFLDLLVIIIMLLTQWGIIHNFFIVAPLALYLVLKGLVFRDLMSYIDLAIGILLILVFFGFHTPLTYAAIVYYIYKLVVSIFV